MSSENHHIDPNTSALKLLQRRFAIVDLAGEIRIVDQTQIEEIKRAGPEASVSLYKRDAANLKMKRLLEESSIPCAAKRVVDQFWLDPGTHTFDRIVNSPLATEPNELNYWAPCPIDPRPGDWAILEAFIREDICGGDQVVGDYVINYIAHMLQRPEEKPGIMIVIIGGQGTGKSTFLRLLARLYPRSTLRTSSLDHVLGRFNGCLGQAFQVHFEEAIFSGDRKGQDQLKSLVTDDVIRIEEKNQPSWPMRSYHRCFSATNHQHAMQIDQDDRRYLFLTTSDAHKQSTEHFGRINSAIDDDAAISAMVYCLLNRDLTNFDVRQKPTTQQTLEQKLRSLDGPAAWWLDVLETGGVQDESDEWTSITFGGFVATERLVKSYKAFDRNAGRYRPVRAKDITDTIQRLCPSAARTRLKQVRGWSLPCYAVACSEFNERTKLDVEWPLFDFDEVAPEHTNTEGQEDMPF